MYLLKKTIRLLEPPIKMTLLLTVSVRNIIIPYGNVVSIDNAVACSGYRCQIIRPS
jgi:hypothetical protein